MRSIVTLSTMFVFMGLRSGISGGSAYTMPRSLWWLGQGGIGWLPYLVLIVLAILSGVSVLYGRTVLGRWLIASGHEFNRDAIFRHQHQANGHHRARVVWLLRGARGDFVGVWQSGNAAPQTGDDWLIISFAVAIIGGTGLKGNLISPLGILMGAIIFKLIQHCAGDFKNQRQLLEHAARRIDFAGDCCGSGEGTLGKRALKGVRSGSRR